MKTKPKSECYIPRLTAVIDMLAIASLWCVSLIIINPFGNFPLNDDWSYALTVKHLIENGDFRPIGWTSMPLITNVLWGSLFCIPAGFSFNALRLSTLTLSLLGILGVYLLMRELRKPRWLASIASLTLCFSPIYYALSNTFMTDVPYTTITILASVCFVRNLRTGSDLPLIIGTTLAIAATLSRQLAISVPLAFAISFILRRGMMFRSIVRAVIPLALCILALLTFDQWLVVTGRIPALYHAKFVNLFQALMNPKTILIFAKNAYVALLYLGWFLLPVLTFVLGSIYGTHRKKIIAILIFSTSAIVVHEVAIAAVNAKSLLLMPRSTNIIIESGIGPLTLHDTFVLNLNIATLPTSFWLVGTVISLLGAALLITAIGLYVITLAPKLWPAKMDANEAAGTFLLLYTMIYLFPLLVDGFFDRYLVPTIPFLAAGIASNFLTYPRTTTKVYRVAAVALLFAFSFFSICGTRDYLEWNRIRWKALYDLMEDKHVKVEDIDGGFEFNGWYLYDPQYKRDPRKSWWWVRGDTYQIGFGPMPGYAITKEYKYLHWMPPHVGKIVVLKENLLEPST